MQNFPQSGGPAPGSYGQAPPPPQKSKAPWIVGGVAGCAVLVLIVVVAVALIIYFANKGGGDDPNSNVNNSNISRPDVETKRYVNSQQGLSGTLAQNYVDFSFDYPVDWKLDPNPEPSFVRVEKTGDDQITIENFSVGWLSTPPGAANNRQLLSQAVNQLSTQISGNFPNYTKVGEGPTEINGYDGYELRFQGAANQGQSNEVKFWGRIIVLPSQTGDNKGVSIVMLATSKAEEVTGISDVGKKGELPVIVSSFKMGK